MAGQPPRHRPGPRLWGLARLRDLAGVCSTLLPGTAGCQVGGSPRAASAGLTELGTLSCRAWGHLSVTDFGLGHCLI